MTRTLVHPDMVIVFRAMTLEEMLARWNAKPRAIHIVNGDFEPVWDEDPELCILVDELAKFPGAKRPFHRGSSHLTTFGSYEGLHRFAERIGLEREWFQDHPLAPHYDLTPSRRLKAVAAGAREMTARETARLRVAYRLAIQARVGLDSEVRFETAVVGEQISVTVKGADR